MRVFVTGAKGQLGRALMRRLADQAPVGADLPELDVADEHAVRQAVTSFRPAVIIHAAAMTDVDGAAREPEQAYRVNAIGTRNVALAAEEAGAALVVVSTNEVFEGKKGTPYLETDPTHPINAYGLSKLAGETFAREIATRLFIVRTAWLYGPGGNHFVKKILARADAEGRLRVVADEVGSPTSVEDLAAAIPALVATSAYGVYHLINEGGCSRYDFARAILDATGRSEVPIEPMRLADYPRPSTPPPYSVLENAAGAGLGVRLRGWREALNAYLATDVS